MFEIEPALSSVDPAPLNCTAVAVLLIVPPAWLVTVPVPSKKTPAKFVVPLMVPALVRVEPLPTRRIALLRLPPVIEAPTALITVPTPPAWTPDWPEIAPPVLLTSVILPEEVTPVPPELVTDPALVKLLAVPFIVTALPATVIEPVESRLAPAVPLRVSPPLLVSAPPRLSDPPDSTRLPMPLTAPL